MKKILFIIALFAIDLTLHAAPVSAGKAAAVAQSFLKQTLQVKQSWQQTTAPARYWHIP